MSRRFGFVLLSILALAFAPGVSAGAPRAAPVVTFPSKIDLPNGWAPEGITAGHGTTVYVGSLANGAIWRGDVRTGTGNRLVQGQSGELTAGVEFDRRSNRIWTAGGATGKVRAYDAANGKLLATYSFAPVGFLNDLVVTNDAVYVTDSGIKQLAVIPLGSGGSLPPAAAARKVPLTGDIAYVPNQFNANGIVSINGWLVIVQTVNGRLFRVDPKTGRAQNIDLGGATVTFGDGLEANGRTLYVVRNMLNRVAIVDLSADLLSGKVSASKTTSGLDTPTTGAFVSGFLWLVNARLNTKITPTTPYWISKLAVR